MKELNIKTNTHVRVNNKLTNEVRTPRGIKEVDLLSRTPFDDLRHKHKRD